MAKIIGDLRADDDHTHALGPEPNFNESMYFNFFDPERSLGGFLRLGNRANEGHAEMTTTVYLPDRRVLFMFKRPEIRDNRSFDAGGCRFEVIEHGQRLRSVYRGSVIELADPRGLSDPSAAFRDSPRRQLHVELEHEAVGPMYGHGDSRHEAERPPEEQFARAHYEQHMRVSGELRLDDQPIRIEGFGLRDHSWGPRRWQAIDGYEWLTMNFGADFGAVVSVIRRHGHERRTGVVVRGDDLDVITDAHIEADFEDNGLYHRALRASVRTARGEALEIEGDVRGFIPLRNRREGRVTHIGEGMTRWRCGDRTGWGLSELLRQV